MSNQAPAARNRSLWIALCICLAVAATVGLRAMLEPLHRAKALVQLPQSSSEGGTEGWRRAGEIGQIISALRSSTLMERAAQRLGIEASSRDLQIRHVRRVVFTPEAGGILAVETTATNPHLARNWAEALVYAFNSGASDSRSRSSNESATEDDEGPAPAPPDVQRRVNEIGRLRVRLQDATLDAATALTLIAEVLPPAQWRKERTDLPRRSSAPDADTPPPVAPEEWPALRDERERLVREINDLPADGSRAAMLLSLAAALDSVNQRLEVLYSAAVAALDEEHQQLLAWRFEPQPAIGGPAAERDTEIRNFEQGRGQLRFLRIVESSPASGRPKLWLTILLGALTGAALGIAGPAALDRLQQSRLAGRRIASKLGVQLIADIPNPAAATSLEDEEWAEHLRAAAEMIMGKLTSSSHGAPRQVILAGPEGDASHPLLAAAIAARLAHEGKRTLLIDADDRGSGVHRLFGLRKVVEASRESADETRGDNVVRETAIADLGVCALRTQEAVGTVPFSRAFIGLSENFDTFIVDAGSELSTSFSTPGEENSTCVLVVVSANASSLREAEQEFAALPRNNVPGLVVSRLDPHHVARFMRVGYPGYRELYRAWQRQTLAREIPAAELS